MAFKKIMLYDRYIRWFLLVHTKIIVCFNSVCLFYKKFHNLQPSDTLRIPIQGDATPVKNGNPFFSHGIKLFRLDRIYEEIVLSICGVAYNYGDTYANYRLIMNDFMCQIREIASVGHFLYSDEFKHSFNQKVEFILCGDLKYLFFQFGYGSNTDTPFTYCRNATSCFLHPSDIFCPFKCQKKYCCHVSIVDDDNNKPEAPFVAPSHII